MLNAHNPRYTERLLDWEEMEETYAGERAIKLRSTVYLPPTPSMLFDGMTTGQPGRAAYEAYLQRAVFPGEVKHAVEGLIGIMHRKQAQIEVPERMRPMLERMTVDGEDVHTLLRKINEAQLVTGRMGLLLEIPDGVGPDKLPFVATYAARTVINWSTWRPENSHLEYDVVVLDETSDVQTPNLDWRREEKYRVLAMAQSMSRRGAFPQITQATGYVAGVATSADPNSAAFTQPSLAGRTLDKIPFVMANAIDVHPDPSAPPLLGLADLCLAIYRGEADYRTALFMQGQETLVIIGLDDVTAEEEKTETRVGAGAVLYLPDGGDAKYVGVTADGLEAMRKGLDADYMKAGERGMRLMDTSEGGGQQSGDALRQRIAAKTASLVTIAEAGGAALQTILRHAAVLLGEDPEKVTVAPNKDFANEIMTGRELMEWAQAKQMGAPISWRSVHEIIKLREASKMTFEEEQAEIELEEPVGVPSSTGAGGPPNGGRPPQAGPGQSTPRGGARQQSRPPNS